MKVVFDESLFCGDKTSQQGLFIFLDFIDDVISVLPSRVAECVDKKYTNISIPIANRVGIKKIMDLLLYMRSDVMTIRSSIETYSFHHENTVQLVNELMLSVYDWISKNV